MLVLTRKVDESIILGKDIEIKVLGIEDGKVKLGINAPKEVEIHRKEIYLSIENENKAASAANPSTATLKEILKGK